MLPSEITFIDNHDQFIKDLKTHITPKELIFNWMINSDLNRAGWAGIWYYLVLICSHVFYVFQLRLSIVILLY